jgi:dipeptidyl aminopeptidase/acylaminoacyl peptidase
MITQTWRIPARRSLTAWILPLGIALVLLAPQIAVASETVSFPSGNKVLHGLLYRPSGSGPFPAVLYNHGSAQGLTNNQAFDLIAPFFTARGWVFFAPYRRGQGLSSDAGPYVLDEIKTARTRGGAQLAEQTLVRLLETEQLQDQRSALTWLKAQSFVRADGVAAVGNSFGGIETVLGAERGGYCAAVDASGGAESWDSAADLQALMLRAARNSQSPIFFLQATNDFSLAPSRTLYAAMKQMGKPAEIHIYPPFGSSPQEGHSFAWRGASVWITDVSRFLDSYCTH